MTKRILALIIFGATSFLNIQVAVAEIIECRFVPESVHDGKTNKVSCAKDPQGIFSTQSKSAHCEDKSVGFEGGMPTEDIESMIIDTKKNTVSWIQKQNEYYVDIMTKYSLEKSDNTLTEADLKKRYRRQTSVDAEILSNFTYSQRIYYSAKLKKEYNPPLELKRYMIFFQDTTNDFSLNISETTKESILTSYMAFDDSNWVEIRFGYCGINK